MSPAIRPAARVDALSLAPRLRAADAGEFLAHARCPTAGLLRAVALSPLAWAIEAPGGRPISLFGFAPIDQDTACPWLVAAEDLVTTHRAWFIRQSAAIVALGDHRWSRFFNYVDARNTVHVRWLRWVGFRVLPAAPHGPYGLPFHAIHRSSPCATSEPQSSAAAPCLAP